MSKEQPNVLAVKPPRGGASTGSDLAAQTAQTAQPRAPGVAVLRAIVVKGGADAVPAKGATARNVAPAAPVPAVPPSAPAPVEAPPAENLTDRLEVAMAEIRRLMAAKRPGRGG